LLELAKFVGKNVAENEKLFGAKNLFAKKFF
jgi:hypothetical protein